MKKVWRCNFYKSNCHKLQKNVLGQLDLCQMFCVFYIYSVYLHCDDVIGTMQGRRKKVSQMFAIMFFIPTFAVPNYSEFAHPVRASVNSPH